MKNFSRTNSKKGFIRKGFLGILFIIFAIFPQVIQAADGDVVWKKNFGGSGEDHYNSVTAVSDGFVSVGYSNASSFNIGDWAGIAGKGGRDAIIVKYDNNSNVLWKKNFGGSGDDEYASVTEVSDGIVAVGYSDRNSFNTGDWTDIDGKGYVNNAIIVKYNNNGDVVWKKNFGGGNYEYDKYTSVTIVSDGIVAVGSSYLYGYGDWEGITGKGGIDATIVKYDHYGNVLWQKIFGGSDHDEYTSVLAVSDGIIAVGYSSENSFNTGDWAGIAGKGDKDAIIVKYNHTGDVVWKKNFGGSGEDYYASITTVSDGIVTVGYSNTSSFNTGDWVGIVGKDDSYQNAIIVKYDNNGNAVWKKNFGNWEDRYNSVTAVSDGIMAVGQGVVDTHYNSGDWEGIKGKGDRDAIIVKYSSNGNVLWKKSFGGSGSDNYNSVAAVSDGIVAVGYSVSSSFNNGDWTGIAGKGGDDAIIVKHVTTGELKEPVTIVVTSNSSGLGSVAGGGIYEKNSTIQIQAFPNSDNIFVSWNDGNINNPRTITVTSNASFTANFLSRQDLAVLFEQTPDLAEIISLRQQVADLQAQLAECGINNTEQIRSASGIQISPNPTTGIVNLSQKAVVKIYNAQGVFLQEIVSDKVDLSAYPQGVYLLQVDGKMVKVIKQ